MMQKLTILFLACVFVLLPLQVEGKDFIVLLDMEESMFDGYDQLVRDYFPDVVKEHLKKHDVFHLMSFAEKPELEIVQKIDTKADMEVVLKRLLLLQPLGKYSDIPLAFRSLDQYAKGLPSYQPKTIIILTAGVYKASKMVSQQEAEKEIESILHMMKNQGWDVRFILMPLHGSAAEDSVVLDLDKISQQKGIASYHFQPDPNFSNQTLGSPRLNYPSDLGNIGHSFSFSFSIKNPSDGAVLLRLKELLFLGQNILYERQNISVNPYEEKTVNFPLEFVTPPGEGSQKGTFELVFEDDVRAYPTQAEIQFYYSPGLSNWLVFGLSAAALVVLALSIFFVIRLVSKKKSSTRAEEKNKTTVSKFDTLQKRSVAQPSGPSLQEAFFVGQAKEETLSSNLSKKSTESLVSSQKKAIETLQSPASTTSDSLKLPDAFLRKPAQQISKENDDFVKKPKAQIASSKVVQLSSKPDNIQVVQSKGRVQDFFLQVWTADLCFQNPQTYPNVITMGPGDRRTVGNSRAAFKIIFRPVQEKLAEVVFDGNDLLFVPLIPQFFPSIVQPELCLNKVIELRLEAQSLYLQFSHYIPKLLQINNFLRGSELAKGPLNGNLSSE